MNAQPKKRGRPKGSKDRSPRKRPSVDVGRPRGPKKPPKTAWQPGQSGNPLGRPAKIRDVIELARANTKEAIEKIVYLMRADDGPVGLRAAEILLDRGWGKATQLIEIEKLGGARAADLSDEELLRIAAGPQPEDQPTLVVDATLTDDLAST